MPSPINYRDIALLSATPEEQEAAEDKDSILTLKDNFAKLVSYGAELASLRGAPEKIPEAAWEKTKATIKQEWLDTRKVDLDAPDTPPDIVEDARLAARSIYDKQLTIMKNDVTLAPKKLRSIIKQMPVLHHEEALLPEDQKFAYANKLSTKHTVGQAWSRFVREVADSGNDDELLAVLQTPPQSAEDDPYTPTEKYNARVMALPEHLRRRLFDIQNETLYAPPPKTGEHPIFKALGAAGRWFASAAAQEGLSEVEKIERGEVSLPPVEELTATGVAGTIPLSPEQQQQSQQEMSAMTRQMAARGFPLPESVKQLESTPQTTRPAAPEEYPGSALLYGQKVSSSPAERALLPPKLPTGEDLVRAARGWNQEKSQGFDEVAARMNDQFFKTSFERAKSEMGPPPEDKTSYDFKVWAKAVDDRTKELFGLYTNAETATAVKHPAETQFAAEFLDPVMNLLAPKAASTVAKTAVRGGLGAVRMVAPEGAKLLESLPALAANKFYGSKLGKELVWGAGAKQLEAQGRLAEIAGVAGAAQNATDIADVTRMAMLEGPNTIELGARRMETVLAPLHNVHRADREVAKMAADGLFDVEKLTPQQRLAYDTLKAYNHQAYQEADAIKGMLRPGEGELEGKLVKAPERADYGSPRRVRSELGEKISEEQQLKEEVLATTQRRPPRASTELKASKARELTPKQAAVQFSKDPLEQALADIADFRKKGTAIATIAKMKEYGETAGVGIQENVPLWLAKEKLSPREKLNKLGALPVEIQVEHTGGSFITIQWDELRSTAEEMARRVLPPGAPKEAAEKLGEKFAAKAQLKLVNDMKNKTGFDWRPFGAEIDKLLERFTGKPGKVIGTDLSYAPKPVVDTVKTFAPLTLGQPNPRDAAWQVVGALTKYVFSPINVPFRMFSTVLGGGFSYHGRNLASVPMLAAIAHGTHAANLKLALGAMKAALPAARMGDEVARATEFTLRNGKKVTMGWIVDNAEKLGLLSQMEGKMGLSRYTGGIGAEIPWDVKSALRDIPGVKSIEKLLSRPEEYFAFGLPIPTMGVLPSSAKLARFTEDFQHLYGFMGFLEGKETKDIARALAKTSEFFGNYQQLSNFSKYVMSEVSPFWAWHSFIFPHLTKQIVEHPEIFSKFVQTRGYFDRKYAPLAPYQAAALGKFTRGMGVTSPDTDPEHANRMTAMNIEMPDSMWLSYAKILTRAGGTSGSLYDLYGPAMEFALEVLTGQDEWGEPIDTFNLFDADMLAADMSLAQKYGGALTKVVLAPAARPMKQMVDMWQLFKQSGNHAGYADLRLRERVGNTLWLLSELFPVAEEDKPIYSVVPGVTQTEVNVLKNLAAPGRVALEGVPKLTRRIEQEGANK